MLGPCQRYPSTADGSKCLKVGTDISSIVIEVASQLSFFKNTQKTTKNTQN